LATAHEAELTRLGHDAAQAGGEATGTGAVDDDTGDGKLAGQALAAGLEENGGGKAARFAVEIALIGGFMRHQRREAGRGSAVFLRLKNGGLGSGIVAIREIGIEGEALVRLDGLGRNLR